MQEDRPKLEKMIDRKLKELRNMKCPDLEAIHEGQEALKVYGNEFQETFQYFQFEIVPCTGPSCETNPDVISDYFANNPVKLMWFDTQFLKD